MGADTQLSVSGCTDGTFLRIWGTKASTLQHQPAPEAGHSLTQEPQMADDKALLQRGKAEDTQHQAGLSSGHSSFLHDKNTPGTEVVGWDWPPLGWQPGLRFVDLAQPMAWLCRPCFRSPQAGVPCSWLWFSLTQMKMM